MYPMFGDSCIVQDFYSRPCGRGDFERMREIADREIISTHAPAGGATQTSCDSSQAGNQFLLTPLREGRHSQISASLFVQFYFYSRPCGRGDSNFPQVRHEVLRQIAER